MPTVDDIWDAGVEYADMTDSSFPNTDFRLPWVNSALSDIHYMLADATPDAEWTTESATITVTSGTGEYALPDGTLYSSAPKFYKLLGLWRVESDVRFPVRKFQRLELSGYKAFPSRNATLLMEYVPAFVNLTAHDDDIDDIYPPGWEEIASMAVGMRLLAKEESLDAMKALGALRGEKLTQLMRGVTPRDYGRPDRIEDVTNRWNRSRTITQTGLPWFYYRIQGSNLQLVEPAPNAAFYTY